MRLRLQISALALAGALLQAACAAPETVPAMPAGTGSSPVSVSEPLSLSSGGTQRTYRLHVPANVSGEVPLVLALHGGGGNSSTMVSVSHWVETADAEGFIVAFPEGVGRMANRATWNAGGCCAYAMTHGSEDITFISNLIDHLSAQYPVDPDRVYMAGLSNGGMLTNRAGALLGDKLAAIGTVVGAMFEDQPVPQAPLPVIAINAVHDDVVPYGGGLSPVSMVARAQSAPFLPAVESAARWADWNGCSETPIQSQAGTVITTRYQGCEDGADVVFVTLEDGGHGWPGGPTRRDDGLPPSDAVDATDLLWGFFAQHPAPPGQ